MSAQGLQKRFPIVIAAACAVFAVILLNMYLKQRDDQFRQMMLESEKKGTGKEAAPAKKMGVVLVAKRDIPPQTPITANDIMIQQVPEEIIQPGAAKAIDQVVDHMMSGPILEKEQILATKLVSVGQMSKSLADITPKGKRAMTIWVDKLSTVGNFLRPGDYVDVLAILPVSAVKRKTADTALVTVPFLQGIEVLAVDSDYLSGPMMPDSKKKKDSGRAGKEADTTVTLSLTLQETLLLTHVLDRGKIKLVMHAAEDEGREVANSVNEQALRRYLYPEEPQAEVKMDSTQQVEIFRGIKKDVLSVSEE